MQTKEELTKAGIQVCIVMAHFILKITKKLNTSNSAAQFFLELRPMSQISLCANVEHSI